MFQTLFKGSWKYLLFWVVITMFLWGFAFSPFVDYDPNWLIRARSVCFGFGDSGLPSAAGWILLIPGSISLLIVLWMVMGAAILNEFKEPKNGKVRKSIILLFILGLSIQIAWASQRAMNIKSQNAQLLTEIPSLSHLPENYTKLDIVSPVFKLIDQDGKKKSLSNFNGKVVIISFVFAHCASICPNLVHIVTTAMREVSSPIVHAVLITLDPWRDSPDSLPSLFKRWKLDGNTTLLSGLPNDVNKALDDFNVPHPKDENTGDITHPALVMIIDKKGKIKYIFNDPSRLWIVDATKIVLREK